MNKNLVLEGKYLIGIHDIEGIIDFHTDLKQMSNESDYDINYQYIFTQLLNHACLKRSKEIIIFLTRVYYEIFDEVAQIGLRQSFTYPKYLIKDKTLTKWYNDNILTLVRAN